MDAPLLRSAALAAALLALAACGSENHGAGRPCTEIGSQPGLSVDIPAPDAARVASAALRVCWDGKCREPKIELRASAATAPMECDRDAPDAACGASASADGGKFGFAHVDGLPKSTVQVTLTLRDARGGALVDRRVDLIPEATFPNGPDCGEGAPQAALTIVNGAVTVR